MTDGDRSRFVGNGERLPSRFGGSKKLDSLWRLVIPTLELGKSRKCEKLGEKLKSPRSRDHYLEWSAWLLACKPEMPTKEDRLRFL